MSSAAVLPQLARLLSAQRSDLTNDQRAALAVRIVQAGAAQIDRNGDLHLWGVAHDLIAEGKPPADAPRASRVPTACRPAPTPADLAASLAAIPGNSDSARSRRAGARYRHAQAVLAAGTDAGADSGDLAAKLAAVPESSPSARAQRAGIRERHARQQLDTSYRSTPEEP